MRARRHVVWVALLLLLPVASWIGSSGGCPCFLMDSGGMVCATTCPMAANAQGGIVICGAQGQSLPMTCCMSANTARLTLPASLMPVVPPVASVTGAAFLVPRASAAVARPAIPAPGWARSLDQPPQA